MLNKVTSVVDADSKLLPCIRTPCTQMSSDSGVCGPTIITVLRVVNNDRGNLGVSSRISHTLLLGFVT